ncbi:hypothetical protein ACH4FE_19880 [Streptomyces celluloflavus]
MIWGTGAPPDWRELVLDLSHWHRPKGTPTASQRWWDDYRARHKLRP